MHTHKHTLTCTHTYTHTRTHTHAPPDPSLPGTARLLFVVGSKDPMCSLTRLKMTVTQMTKRKGSDWSTDDIDIHVVKGGKHSIFDLPKKDVVTERALALQVIKDFLMS